MLKHGLCLFVLVVLGCADISYAQERKKIGILSGGFAESPSARNEARQPRTSVHNLGPILQELGWSEGRNVRFEERYAKGQLGQLPEFARQLVQNKMDVIVAMLRLLFVLQKTLRHPFPSSWLMAAIPSLRALLPALRVPAAM